MIDLRFAPALQAMLLLAVDEREGHCSTTTTLAARLGASTASLPQVLAPLHIAGLLAVRSGDDDGVCLALPPEQITLRDVYLAVAEERTEWQARTRGPLPSFVTMNMTAYFDDLASTAEKSALDVLAARTLGDTLEDLQEMDSRRTAAAPNGQNSPS